MSTPPRCARRTTCAASLLELARPRPRPRGAAARRRARDARPPHDEVERQVRGSFLGFRLRNQTRWSRCPTGRCRRRAPSPASSSATSRRASRRPSRAARRRRRGRRLARCCASAAHPARRPAARLAGLTVRITSLRLQNVKRHATLDFAPGMTVVRGPNESGKSTVQRAIEMVLFRRPTSTAQEMDSVRPWGKATAEPTVELAFDVDGVAGSLAEDLRRAARHRQPGLRRPGHERPGKGREAHGRG